MDHVHLESSVNSAYIIFHMLTRNSKLSRKCKTGNLAVARINFPHLFFLVLLQVLRDGYGGVRTCTTQTTTPHSRSLISVTGY